MAEQFSSSNTIPVQVCYADPDRQIVLNIEVTEETTLIQAIEQSGIASRFALRIRENEVGIYGKKRSFDTRLKAHDRIEIYRPLRTTPQERRRLYTDLQDR